MAATVKKRRREAVYVPDGGWGWVIVACSFLIHMFVVGTLYASSVLYVSWLEAFDSGKGVTSWIISMAVAVMFGIGPLPASLSRRFGNRPVVMMGGIMMSAGFFLGSFAMNVYFLIFTVGILAGVGAGCCYLPSVALVAQYFTSKQSFAMGISASGLGVGAFFMAPFLNWLVEYFGWRGTMQILSGISLNMCVLASLMRPLELAPHCRNCKWLEESDWTTTESHQDDGAERQETSEDEGEGEGGEEEGEGEGEEGRGDLADGDGGASRKRGKKKKGERERERLALSDRDREEGEDDLEEGNQHHHTHAHAHAHVHTHAGMSSSSSSSSSTEVKRKREGHRWLFECGACGKPSQRMIRLFDAKTDATPINNYFLSPSVIQNHSHVIPFSPSVVVRHHVSSSRHASANKKDDKRDGGVAAKHAILPAHAYCADEVAAPTTRLLSASTNDTHDLSPLSISQCDCSPVIKTELNNTHLGGSLNNLGKLGQGEEVTLNHQQRSLTVSHIPYSPHRVEGGEPESGPKLPPHQLHGGEAESTNHQRDMAIPDNKNSYAKAVSYDPAEASAVPYAHHPANDDKNDDSFLQFHEKEAGEHARPEVGAVHQQKLFKCGSIFSGVKLQFCCTLKYMESAKVYIKLMHSSIFMVFCLSNFLTNLSFLMPVLYMVDRAIDSGIGKNEAALLVSIYGTGNIFGKVFFGWLSDRKLLDRLIYYIFCLSMCGGATCASPLCGSSLTLHGLYALSFGCFIGAYCTLFPLVTVDLVGISVVEESFGMLLCFMGTATAFGTPLAGWMFDFTGSYTWAFFLHGTFILISALMLIPLLWKKPRASTKSH